MFSWHGGICSLGGAKKYTALGYIQSNVDQCGEDAPYLLVWDARRAVPRR